VFKVELRPHKGKKKTQLGLVEVTLPQDVVMIHVPEREHPIWSGYVGIGKKAGIALIIKGLAEEQLVEIKKQVDVIRAEKGLPPTTGINQLKSIDQNQYKVVTEPDIDDDDDIL